MFADNITWQNDSLRRKAEAECGDDFECLFDVASTNDLSVGLVTKDISIQLVNELNALSKSEKGYSTLVLNCVSSFSPQLKWVALYLRNENGPDRNCFYTGQSLLLEKNSFPLLSCIYLDFRLQSRLILISCNCAICILFLCILPF